MCFAVIWCLLFAWKEVCGLVVPCGSQLGRRQCSVLSLISDSVSSRASCLLDLIFFFLLKLRSSRVIRVFKPLTRYSNRIVGFPERRNRIWPAKPTRWALGRSDSSGLIESWTRWTALIWGISWLCLPSYIISVIFPAGDCSTHFLKLQPTHVHL